MKAPKHITLRWSAMLFKVLSYKHRAPPEHFTEATTLSGKAGWRVGGWTGLEGSGFKGSRWFKGSRRVARKVGLQALLCAASVSSVPLWLKKSLARTTTETQRTQRLHRETIPA